MKKYILGLIFLSLSVLGFSQNSDKITTSVRLPNFVYIWGASTSDTVVASQTKTASIRVYGDNVTQLNMRLSTTKISGTVTNNVLFYGSFDGTTLDVPIDTIVNTNVSTGYKYVTPSRWTAFNYPYLIVKIVAPATAQKAWYRLDFIGREN